MERSLAAYLTGDRRYLMQLMTTDRRGRQCCRGVFGGQGGVEELFRL